MQRKSKYGLMVVVCALLVSAGAHAQSDTEAMLILNQNALDAGDSQLILLTGPDDAVIRSLDELETRIVLMPPGPDDPIPVSATAVISITQPGSYVLGGNLFGVAGKHGIEILKSNVTLDLNGYALIGLPGAKGGIDAPSGIVNIKIHNGGIRGWPQRGIGGMKMNASEVSDVRVGNCGWNGIHLGSGIVRNCTSRQNGNDGIHIEHGKSVVRDCAVELNGGDGVEAGDYTTISNVAASGNNLNGLSCGDGCTITGCTTSENGDAGILAGDHCNIADCVTTGNANGVWVGNDASISNVQANENTAILAREQGGERIPALGFGFLASDRCIFTGCTASNNTTYGFSADSSAVLSDCVAEQNGLGGIHAGPGSSIKSCVVKYNGSYGITVGDGGLVESCLADDNNRSDLSAHGIRGNDDAVVRNCVVRNHNFVGLSVRSGSTVERNQCSGNLFGIVVYLSGTRVDGNNLYNNDVGVNVSGDGNFVFRNTMSNTTNFQFTGTDFVGPITSNPATAGPWANLIIPPPP